MHFVYKSIHHSQASLHFLNVEPLVKVLELQRMAFLSLTVAPSVEKNAHVMVFAGKQSL